MNTITVSMNKLPSIKKHISKKKKYKVNVINQDKIKCTENEDDGIAWRHVIFWQLLGVCLPTFDVYSDIAYMIVNLLQFHPVQNDFVIPPGGDCTAGKYENTSYCQLSHSEQCK